MQKIPVLVIFAPTATGKTALVEKLFADNADSTFAGKAEIINSDSMQVYRGLDIGTAKPDSEFLKHLPHHLIDICSPKEQFGVGEFLPLADRACADIFSRGKLPVVCGGTAFYIRNFIYGLPTTPKADLSLREKLQARLKTDGAEVLMAELRERDAQAAARIHINDEYRILRALEVCYASGKSLSSFALSETPREKYDFTIVELTRPREELYERINARVENMFDAGLPEEFRQLAAAGFVREDPGMQAIGYREFFMAADKFGKSALDCICDADYLSLVKNSIKSDSRHYAKRQVTFFAPMKNVARIAAENAFESISPLLTQIE